jgi:serine/threonine protein kinase
MKLLNHPHIVGVTDVYEGKDHYFIVMENASGGELFDYIVKNGMVKEPEARHFFRQILSAVDYCHQVLYIEKERLICSSNVELRYSSRLETGKFITGSGSKY